VAAGKAVDVRVGVLAVGVVLLATGCGSGNGSPGKEGHAKGRVEVVEWGCEKGDTVRISVDATLDGELFKAPTATVKGEIEASIGDPLPVPYD
jgi:hypothetical protein